MCTVDLGITTLTYRDGRVHSNTIVDWTLLRYLYSIWY